MKYIKLYKIFESSTYEDTIKDYLLDINDNTKWSANFLFEDNTYIIHISPIMSEEDFDDEDGVIKFDKNFLYSIQSIISFMGSEGFKYILVIGQEDDSPPGYNIGYPELDYHEDNIDIVDLSNREMYCNEYIRLEFKK
jgi:hypothetical protein